MRGTRTSDPMLLLVLVLAPMSVGAEPMPPRHKALDPCRPSPCGPNTECSVNHQGVAVCRCIPGYFPKPDTITGCDVQCRSDSECASEYACASNKCVNPCQPGACGRNAICKVRHHRAECECPTGYDGDPNFDCKIRLKDVHHGSDYGGYVQSRNPDPVVYSGGSHLNHHGGGGGGTISFSRPSHSTTNYVQTHHHHQQHYQEPYSRENADPCFPNPCGAHTKCRTSGSHPVCTCDYGFYGNPETGCIKGECVETRDCSDDRVCKEFHCTDPCPGTCGTDAQCIVRRHVPVCTCPAGHTGDPFNRCRRLSPEELCNPSPCGKNSKCEAANHRAVCSCLPHFFGNPLEGCRAECESDSSCALTQECRQYKCVNPCAEACGENAECRVEHHRAICSCPKDFLGDARTRCYPECTAHEECAYHQACVHFKCGDPCVGACGINAECRVENHKPICSCPKGYTGHPFDHCKPFNPADLCRPSPCGVGAECTPGTDNQGNNRAVCTCPQGYIGDPLVSCTRGECIQSSDCPDFQHCTNYRCEDPCGYGRCGINAECRARNHAAICSCPQGYTGDPLSECRLQPATATAQSRPANAYSKVHSRYSRALKIGRDRQ